MNEQLASWLALYAVLLESLRAGVSNQESGLERDGYVADRKTVGAHEERRHRR